MRASSQSRIAYSGEESIRQTAEAEKRFTGVAQLSFLARALLGTQNWSVRLTRDLSPINSRGSGFCAFAAHCQGAIARRTARRLLWARSIAARVAFQCSGALPVETLGVDAPEKQRRTIKRPMHF